VTDEELVAVARGSHTIEILGSSTWTWTLYYDRPYYLSPRRSENTLPRPGAAPDQQGRLASSCRGRHLVANQEQGDALSLTLHYGGDILPPRIRRRGVESAAKRLVQKEIRRSSRLKPKYADLRQGDRQYLRKG
jgi:hypothetical protein